MGYDERRDVGPSGLVGIRLVSTPTCGVSIVDGRDVGTPARVRRSPTIRFPYDGTESAIGDPTPAMLLPLRSVCQ